jgi:hypothetical protein
VVVRKSGDPYRILTPAFEAKHGLYARYWGSIPFLGHIRTHIPKQLCKLNSGTVVAVFNSEALRYALITFLSSLAKE